MPKKDKPEPTSPNTDIKLIQQIIGHILYYAQAIGCSMLPTLIEIGQ